MNEVRLGIDVACRADHRASLADERGEFIWSSWKFRTTTADLERLWAKIPDGASVIVILEPTRNAWVPLSAWLQARRHGDLGATRAVGQFARLLQQAHQDRPVGLSGPGTSAAAAPRGPPGHRQPRSRGVTSSGRPSPLQPGQAPQCGQSASRGTRRAARTGLGRFPRIGHRLEDRPGRLGEIRRSTGAQASRAGPARLVVDPLELGTVARGQGRRTLGHGGRDPGTVVGRRHRLQRVGPRHRLRSQGAAPARRRDRGGRQADRRSL